MFKNYFRDIWRIVKILALIQFLNVVMDYFMCLEYGYLIPSWEIPTLTGLFTIFILAIKNAQENEMKTNLP